MMHSGRRAGLWGQQATGVLATFVLALALVGCNGNPKPDDVANGGYAAPGSPRDFITRAGDIVYFSTDSTELSVESQQTLVNQARWLKKYPEGGIMIEGHADERGTREYNIALGAKRAQAVRAFLIQQGINAARIRTASYGKERPVAVCNDISCWSQNRRAQTVVNGRHDARS
ncbi:MAG TPA: peptidoglycan-associated lipoprotein Pal [Hyphomicrobiaceae bacterium]|nr:peptidoglycan-associated lipoprotein Pal [Hyphomicrobiaceae bacterium]